MTPPEPRCSAAILAGGLGTRMKSSRPKVLHELLGRPMLAWVLEAAAQVDLAGPPVIVFSPATMEITRVFAGQAVFALQHEPRGTGDAVRAALGGVPDDATELLVLSGDVPLVNPQLLTELVQERRAEDAAIALIGVEAFEPAGLGRIVRDPATDRVLRVVEEKDAAPDELELDEINAGVYAFDLGWLRRRIGDVPESEATGELYLTELVALANADRRAVVAITVEDDGTLLGVNDRVQLGLAAADLRYRINAAHMRAGVTIQDTETTWIEPTVELAADVAIEPNVILRGATKVGTGTLIRAGSQIFDTVIGERCVIWASVLESSEVEDDVQIGPFSHLRPGSSIGPGAKLGNYAEVKGSRLGPGVQQHHFSYIGDAELGERTNVGAGTITCNYDGVRKHRTKIGRRVFLGSDTMLVAPLEIGDDAKTGAGSVVTHDVPPGKLAVGVPARIRDPRADPVEGDAPAVAADVEDGAEAPRRAPGSRKGPPPAAETAPGGRRREVRRRQLDE